MVDSLLVYLDSDNCSILLFVLEFREFDIEFDLLSFDPDRQKTSRSALEFIVLKFCLLFLGRL